MKTEDLVVRCLLRRDGDQWVALCVDFDLAAQGSTRAEAKQHLAAQIVDYVMQAQTVDKAHGARLLRRKAPLKYRALFHWLTMVDHWNNAKKRGKAYFQPLPLVPAAC